MPYTPKDGDGTLFPVEDKTNDKAPDVTGYITAHRDIRQGERVRLAGWRKTLQSGKRLLNLKMLDERERGETPQRQGGDPADLNDEIPF